MFTYTSLSLVLAGAILLFVVMRLLVDDLCEKLGYAPTSAILWTLFAFHWMFAFGLIVSFSSWNIPRLSSWYVLSVVFAFMVLMCLYLTMVDRLEREKRLMDMREVLCSISKRQLEGFRERMRRRLRRTPA